MTVHRPAVERDAMNLFDTKYSDLAPLDLVRLGYLLLLRRSVDPTGLDCWTQRIDAGTFRLEQA